MARAEISDEEEAGWALPWIIATVILAVIVALLLFWLARANDQLKDAQYPIEPAFCFPKFGTAEPQYSGPDGSKRASTAKGFGAPAADVASGKPEESSSPFVRVASRYERATADESEIHAGLRHNIPLTPSEARSLPGQVFRDSQNDGVPGFYRLALLFLGEDAFAFASEDEPKRDRLHVPFCSDDKPIVDPDVREAYIGFAMVRYCSRAVSEPYAQRWIDKIRSHYPRSVRNFPAWNSEAYKRLLAVFDRHDLDPESSDGWRQVCLGFDSGEGDTEQCEDAKTALEAFNIGKMHYADGNQRKARACYNKAIELAKTDPYGPDVGPKVKDVLQNSSCKMNRASLDAIKRDYQARSTDLIRVETIQQALRALGYYDGPIDNQMNAATRAAITAFQRNQGDDETELLTPTQITQLMCNAAETEDLASQTTLGVMYILGDGVVQNVDSAQQWLLRAANRHYPDASYNLAMLYGTGIILDSYRFCDVPRAPELADRYLAEAADAHGYSVAPGTPPCKGQLMARKILTVFGPGSKYGSLPAADRWLLIERQAIDKIRSGPFADKFQNIGKKCSQVGGEP